MSQKQINMFRYKENAEFAKARAKFELLNSTKPIKNLSSMINESNSRAGEIEMWKKSETCLEEYRYAGVMKEIEVVKQESSKLKLDILAARQLKLQAEKEIEATDLKLSAISSSVEALKEEIEAANEDQVFVELSRIEALKEYEEIEAEREKGYIEFSFKFEETEKKMKDMVLEINQASELENKLAVTLDVINVLQNEVQLSRKMAKRNDTLMQKELERSPILQSIIDELEAAKKELISIKEVSFRVMASMDIVRRELKQVSEETARLKKTKEKENLKVQSLKSKLLKSQSKLEAASASEKKSSTIVSSLMQTLQKLESETESAKRDKGLLLKETETLNEETQKTENDIGTTEEKFQAAMRELEAVKSSEASALENLKNLTKNTMRARTAAYQDSSYVVISKFEYTYLKNRAGGAEDIADKKVEAARAWIESLKASEREIVLKREMARRQIRGMRVDEEKEVYQTERSLSAKRMLERQMHNWGTIWERAAKQSVRMSTPKRTPSRRGKSRRPASPTYRMARPASPAYRLARSGSFAVKKKKVIPNLSRFFNAKKTDKLK